VFHEYLQAEERIRMFKEENEKKRSEELYRAWQQSSQRATNQKSTGVAVIKTIVKQANKPNGDESNDIQRWEQRATALLQEAAQTHEHPEALVRLANQSLDKISEETIDTEVVFEKLHHILGYYDKACRLGSKEGCFNHGNLVWTGFEYGDTPILVPDPKLALVSFQKAIDLGDTDSMYFVGVVLLSEDDEDEEVNTESRNERRKMGLEFIERAASLHHPGALYYLCIFYLNGNEELGIPPCSPQEFAERLDAAVDAGDAEALFLRGHSFYCGDTPPYPVDYPRALQDFLAAAELGHADAAISAGAILHQPHPGVKQDQRRAFLLYQQAGELGNKEGWRNVVACYVNGEGVPQSHETAKYIAETMLKKEDE
jgi:TPR repeat protein